jgi:hypothetical protein
MFSFTLMPFYTGDTEQEASWTEKQEKRKISCFSRGSNPGYVQPHEQLINVKITVYCFMCVTA